MGPEMAGDLPEAAQQQEGRVEKLVLRPLWGISPRGSGQNRPGSGKGEDAQDPSLGSSWAPRLALGPVL